MQAKNKHRRIILAFSLIISCLVNIGCGGGGGGGSDTPAPTTSTPPSLSTGNVRFSQAEAAPFSSCAILGLGDIRNSVVHLELWDPRDGARLLAKKTVTKQGIVQFNVPPIGRGDAGTWKATIHKSGADIAVQDELHVAACLRTGEAAGIASLRAVNRLAAFAQETEDDVDAIAINATVAASIKAQLATDRAYLIQLSTAISEAKILPTSSIPLMALKRDDGSISRTSLNAESLDVLDRYLASWGQQRAVALQARTTPRMPSSISRSQPDSAQICSSLGLITPLSCFGRTSLPPLTNPRAGAPPVGSDGWLAGLSSPLGDLPEDLAACWEKAESAAGKFPSHLGGMIRVMSNGVAFMVHSASQGIKAQGTPSTWTNQEKLEWLLQTGNLLYEQINNGIDETDKLIEPERDPHKDEDEFMEHVKEALEDAVDDFVQKTLGYTLTQTVDGIDACLKRSWQDGNLPPEKLELQLSGTEHTNKIILQGEQTAYPSVLSEDPIQGEHIYGKLEEESSRTLIFAISATGTANEDTDFHLNQRMLTFKPGELYSTNTISIDPINDGANDTEPLETVLLHTSDDGAIDAAAPFLLKLGETNVEITANPSPLTIIDGESAQEADRHKTLNFTLSAQRNRTTSFFLEFPSGGSAIPNTDFRCVPPLSLGAGGVARLLVTIPSNTARSSVEMHAIPDLLKEGEETADGQLALLPSGAKAEPTQASIHVKDDALPNVSLLSVPTTYQSTVFPPQINFTVHCSTPISDDMITNFGALAKTTYHTANGYAEYYVFADVLIDQPPADLALGILHCRIDGVYNPDPTSSSVYTYISIELDSYDDYYYTISSPTSARIDITN